jgi:hypothetical protein
MQEHTGLVVALVGIMDDRDPCCRTAYRVPSMPVMRIKPAIRSPCVAIVTASPPLLDLRERGRTYREHDAFTPHEIAMVFFTFPEARWNPDRDAVEFSVILGQYEGTVRVPRRVFQHLLDRSPTRERCMEAFHLQRTRFELIVERKLRRRQLTDDGNVEITGPTSGTNTSATKMGRSYPTTMAGEFWWTRRWRNRDSNRWSPPTILRPS